MRISNLLLLLLSVSPVTGPVAHADGPHDGPAHEHGHGPGHHGDPMVHRFEDPARWAKEFDDPARDAWQKPAELMTVMQLLPGMTVADLGAGTGYLLPHLCRAVGPRGKVLALDIEASMVRYLEARIAREKLSGATAKQVALDDPQLAEASVERIVVLDVWHHVPERVAYAKKLLRALTPTGALYIVDFTQESAHGPPKKHRLTPQAVIAELTAAGLRAEVVSESLPDQYVVVGRRPATAGVPGTTAASPQAK
jgi:predicted methyltransferase